MLTHFTINYQKIILVAIKKLNSLILGSCPTYSSEYKFSQILIFTGNKYCQFFPSGDRFPSFIFEKMSTNISTGPSVILSNKNGVS